MSANFFKVRRGLTIGASVSDPVDAENGDIYYNATDNKFRKYENGAWSNLGSGEGGGASDLDTILSQDFNSAASADFTQVGLAFNTLTPIQGAQSARLIHQAGVSPTNDQYFKQTVAIDRKFRGAHASMSLNVRSTATSGNLVLKITDETNATTLVSSSSIQTDSISMSATTTNASTTVSAISTSNIALIKVGMSVTGSGIPTGTVVTAVNSTALTITISAAATASASPTLRFSALPTVQCFAFTIPESCQSISYTITALPESGSPETYIDDLVIRKGLISYSQTSATVQVPVMTEWESWTPTSSATGTTNVNWTGKWRRVGDILQGRIFMQAVGALAAFGDLNFSIAPLGLTIDTTKVPSALIGNRYKFGGGIFSDAGLGEYEFDILGDSTTTFVVRYRDANPSSIAATQKAITNAAPFTWGNGDFLEGYFEVPISNWDALENKSLTFSSPVAAGQSLYQATSVTVPVIGEVTTMSSITGAWTSGCTYSGKYQRIGDHALITVNMAITGAVTAADLTFTSAQLLGGSGLAIDTAKLAATATADDVVAVGTWGGEDSGLSRRAGSVVWIPSEGKLRFPTASVSDITPSAPYTMSANDSLSFTIRLPISGWTTTETKSIPLTSAVFQTEADSELHMYGYAGYGSSGTRIMRFTSIQKSVGDAITYISDSVNGDRFVVNRAGVYDFSFSTDAASGTIYGVTKNQTSLTTSPDGLTQSEVISVYGYDAGATGAAQLSGSAILAVGDIVRLCSSGNASNANTFTHFTITYSGKIKQINVSSDQKVEIPTSELRLEGCSSRGSVATGIAKFDSVAKIKGDGMIVSNDASLGTYITVQKAGILHVSTTLYKPASNSLFQITKNQAVLTSYSSTPAELLAQTQANNTAGEAMSISCSGVSVVPGDIIRVAAFTVPATDWGNNLVAVLQETKVQVALSNVLPQFTESDGVLRIDGANSYGSSHTMIRRFSNVRINTVSNNVAYTDSATEGTKLTILKSGTYTFNYSDDFNAISSIGLSLNTTAPTTSIQSISSSERLALDTVGGANHAGSVSWTGYLNAGDVVRPHTAGAPVGLNNITTLTVSYHGKPNITSVDVTPFVNIPQGIDRCYLSTLSGNFQLGSVRKNTTEGEITVSNPSASALRITANRKVTAVISVQVYNGSAGVNAANFNVIHNGITLQNVSLNVNNSTVNANPPVFVTMEVGDTVEFATASGTTAAQWISVLTREVPNTIVAQNSTYRASELASSNVSTTPSVVGQYQYLTRNASAYTFANSTPAILPSSTNGFPIWEGNGFTTADTASNPTKLLIFIGKGLEKVDFEWHRTTGRTGFIDTTPGHYSNASTTARDVGYVARYDKGTGLVTVARSVNLASTANDDHYAGRDENGQILSLGTTALYLDVLISKNPLVSASVPRGEVIVGVSAALNGSVNTKIRRFDAPVKTLGSAITHTDSATEGSKFVINEPGVYAMSYVDYATVGHYCGISVNATALTTDITALSYAAGRRSLISATASNIANTAVTLNLNAGDIVRAHNNGNVNNGGLYSMFVITKVSN